MIHDVHTLSRTQAPPPKGKKVGVGPGYEANKLTLSVRARKAIFVPSPVVPSSERPLSSNCWLRLPF